MILWIFVKIFKLLALTIKNSTHHNLDVRDLINFDTHLNWKFVVKSTLISLYRFVWRKRFTYIILNKSLCRAHNKNIFDREIYGKTGSTKINKKVYSWFPGLWVIRDGSTDNCCKSLFHVELKLVKVNGTPCLSFLINQLKDLKGRQFSHDPFHIHFCF